MGKDSPGQMKEKDIRKLIDLQKEANRVNQETPTGSLTYSGDTATTSLSPEEQSILEQNQLARLLGAEQAGKLFSGVEDGRASVERAVYDRAVSLMDPTFARREEQLRQRLANQGLPQESAAFTAELGRFDDAYSRSVEQAALNAVLAGGAEESRIYQNILGLAGYGAPAYPSLFNIPQVGVPYQPGGEDGGGGWLSPVLGVGGAAVGGYFGGPAGATAGYGVGSGTGQMIQGR